MQTRIRTNDVQAIATCVQRNESFKTNGSLIGCPRLALGMGRLDPLHYESARMASYVLYSYSTPIAWLINGEWIIPSDKYSPTTSNHQRVAACVARIVK